MRDFDNQKTVSLALNKAFFVFINLLLFYKPKKKICDLINKSQTFEVGQNPAFFIAGVGKSYFLEVRFFISGTEFPGLISVTIFISGIFSFMIFRKGVLVFLLSLM